MVKKWYKNGLMIQTTQTSFWPFLEYVFSDPPKTIFWQFSWKWSILAVKGDSNSVTLHRLSCRSLEPGVRGLLSWEPERPRLVMSTTLAHALAAVLGLRPCRRYQKYANISIGLPKGIEVTDFSMFYLFLIFPKFEFWIGGNCRYGHLNHVAFF